MIIVYYSKELSVIRETLDYARVCVEDYCKVARLKVSESLDIIKDVNGKPHVSVSGMYVSLTHISNLIVCAVASTPIGIDVELTSRHIKEPLYSKLVLLKSQKETVVEFWTKIESLSKLIGCGIACGIFKLVDAMSTGCFIFEKIILTPEYTCTLCKTSNAFEKSMVKSKKMYNV